MSATRCGSMVTGAEAGAAIENIAPVMSIRVDGPGADRSWKFSTKRAETMCMIGPLWSPDAVTVHPHADEMLSIVETHQVGSSTDPDLATIVESEQTGGIGGHGP